PIARWLPGDSLLAEAPAITANAVGKGWVIYIGGYSSVETITTLTSSYLNTPFPAPPEVEVVIRKGRGKTYAVVLNHSQSSQRISIATGWQDLLNRTSVKGDLKLPAFGATVLMTRF